MLFCPKCAKCPSCCLCASRVQTKPILVHLADSRRNNQGGTNLEGGLHSTIQISPKLDQATNHCEWLCLCPKEHLSAGGSAATLGQKCYRKGQTTKFSSLFQPLVSGTETKQQMEANPRPKCPKQIFEGGYFQNGNSRDHTDISAPRGVGHVHRFQGRILSHSYPSSVQEISEISFPRSVLSVQGTTLRSVDSSYGVHDCGQGSKTDGSVQGYTDPPVPRRLACSGSVIPRLPQTNQRASSPLQKIRLDSQCREVGTRSQTSIRLCGLSIRPAAGQGETHPRQMASASKESSLSPVVPAMSSPTADVSDWLIDSYREISPPRAASHETNSVAFKKPLENPGIIREMDSNSQVPPCSPKMVAERSQCTGRASSTSDGPLGSNLHGCLERGVGSPPRRSHVQGSLVPSREQITHQSVRAEGSSPGPQGIPKLGVRQDSPDCHRQHDSSGIYQQAGGHEVRKSVCPLVENPVLVRQKRSADQSPPHSRQTQCGGGQAVTSEASHTDRVVACTRGVQVNLSDLAHSTSGLVCDSVQQQVTTVCIPSARSKCLGSGLAEPVLGGSGSLRLSSNGSSGKDNVKGQGQSLPKADNHSTRVAKNAMVLGPSGNGSSGAPVSTKSTKSSNPTIQPGSTRKPGKPKSTRVAPRATSIRQQGFSEEVASRIEAPQRSSTRTVYEAKWSVFARWCEDNQVDVRAPPVKSIADFLLYLFQERNLQPSTIDGYRSAIADRLGNAQIDISKNENITRLLDSFHRDRPKGRRGVPAWNLSLVLHQLTKPPFEPLHKASLKHLTFKTVFLMALASGKRRSEIHAWVFKNIRNQADWSTVSMYPSPSFLSKNQLARDGPNSVAPVVIPALAPTLDRSLREDRTLCPVRALRYYTDGTSHLRQNKELVFVSFKKGFDKDISPSTISSWIKQTVVFCYEQSDQEAQNLHRVKAHDVRAFAASKAFHSGMSLEQLLSACHWKSHNTFTQFYLKDVAWADSEQFHLGPVVAAQQIHHN